MKIPLSARIAGHFALNLALVALLFYGFVRAQFHLGLDSLIAGRAGDRMEAVAAVIGDELMASPRESWDEILQRFSASYGVKFLVCRENGEQVAGDSIDLPPPVRGAIAELGRHGPDMRHFFHGVPPPFADNERRPPPPPPPAPIDQPKKLLRAGNPERYWAVERLPVHLPDRPGPPLTLVTVSDSLSAGGLFFDWRPWVAAALMALTVSALCWFPLARGINAAIRRLTDATGQIAQGHFDARVNENRSDELGSLARSVNRMASRLEGFVDGQKRFLGDTAHELCAPIARLQMALGVLEQRSGGFDAPIQDLREEIEQMSSLVGELLSFSKASLGDAAVERRAVELRPLIEQAVARETTPGVQFELAIPAEAKAMANPDLLLRALANLLRNAARYAGDAGPIEVRGTQEGGWQTIVVADRGPGIPAEAMAKIFDPFYRVDVSRDRATGGVGLGLAIVKTCVEACGGTVSCRQRSPRGLEVTVRLTAAQ